MSGALCFAADTPEHIRAFYIDYGYAIYLLSVFPRKYTMAAMMIMTTKSPSMPCHIIVRAVPKFAIILALPLSEESEDDTAGNCGSDLSGNICAYGMHKQVVGRILRKSQLLYNSR